MFHPESHMEQTITPLHLPSSAALVHGDRGACVLSQVALSRRQKTVDHGSLARLAGDGSKPRCHGKRHGRRRHYPSIQRHHGRFNEGAFYGSLFCWYAMGSVMMLFVWLMRRRR
jgi:hypothetical protein